MRVADAAMVQAAATPPRRNGHGLKNAVTFSGDSPAVEAPMEPRRRRLTEPEPEPEPESAGAEERIVLKRMLAQQAKILERSERLRLNALASSSQLEVWVAELVAQLAQRSDEMQETARSAADDFEDSGGF